MVVDDLYFMKIAYARAVESAGKGEVPVGAALVDEQCNILASAGNAIIDSNDPVGHAEILTLRRASEVVANYRLPGTTMYVTLEPCAMCAAAMVHARIGRLVFGATDPKTGAIVSKYKIGQDGFLNHTFSVTSGVMEKECGQLLKTFFQKRR